MSTSHSSKEIRHAYVFCGSSREIDKVYLEAVKHLGQQLARRRINFIYEDESLGSIGSVAIAAKCNGAKVVGIIRCILVEGNLCGKTIGSEEKVSNISECLKTMLSKSDAFIALPGGLGTLEEIFMIISRNLLGIHSRPLGLLNLNGFYDGLLKFLDYVVEQNFLIESGRQIFVTASLAEELLDKMQIFYPESDTATSKLNWEKGSQKHPLDLNLCL